MSHRKPQISIMAILLCVAGVAVACSWWSQRDLASRHKLLQEHNSAIEEDYRIRARVMNLLMQLNADSEDDRKTLNVIKRFTPYLSSLDKIGEESRAMLFDLGKAAQLHDVDGKDGGLEILLLTSVAKSSPGTDRSLVILYNNGIAVDSFPVETGTRTWHEVTLGDLNSDGVEDVKIQHYVPGNAAAKTVTKEFLYQTTNGGFEDLPDG